MAVVLTPGLPNITGSLYSFAQGGACLYDGALYAENGTESGGSPATEATVTARSWQKLFINAAKSNSIYGASQTVQPPALSLIPQIKY